MRRTRTFALLTGAILLLGSATVASAVSELGESCWADNFGGTWKLNMGGYAGTANIAVNGVRIVPALCNGVHEQPVVGSLRVNASGIVFGLESIANEPGVCTSVTWHGVLDFAVAEVKGTFRNQDGDQGPFSIVPIPCTAPFDGGGAGGAVDPSRVR
jgi:hypothetical protein